MLNISSPLSHSMLDAFTYLYLEYEVKLTNGTQCTLESELLSGNIRPCNHDIR